jgi:hypothetical protein
MIALATFAAMLCACQSTKYTPKPKNAESTLLIIPLQFANQTKDPFPVQFSLNFDGSMDSRTLDLIDFSKPYAFIKTLSPGTHKITRLLSRWSETGQIMGQYDLSLPFTVSAGEAAVLPYRFNVLVKDKRYYFSTPNILANEMKEIKKDLMEYENIEAWILQGGDGN